MAPRFLLIARALILAEMMAYSVGGTLISGLQALNLSSGTQIELPSNRTERWSRYRAPSYSAIVKPSTDEDVAAIIKYATNTKTPFLTTGGGHGFSTTLERLRDGISIDLSNFRDVELDTVRNTLTIGGAVRFEDVIGPLGDGKKQLPIGSENCVGMVGAALGGGVSRYNGLHGMLLDTLLSVKMVTASGEIIYVSNTTNADLFWGLRGAGFHFGTILEATFSVFDQSPEQVLLADFLFAPNASKTILDYYKTFDNVLPAELSFVSLSLNAPTLGGSIILVNAVYTGPREEGERYLQPLLQASPLRQNLTMVPWASVNAASFFAIEGPGFHCPTGNVHNVYGSAVHTFDVPTFQTFYENYDALIQSPELAGTVYFIEMFPKQAVEQVPAEATAYPWRNITTHLLFNFAYNVTTDLDERINGFARQARDNFTAVSGFDPPQLYVLYGHGDEDPTTLYSAANLPRLRDLKAKWDPSNAYGYNYPLHDI